MQHLWVEGSFGLAPKHNPNSYVPNASMFPGVTFAAKGYFDALVRMGELASESHGSKDLGEFV